MAPRARHLRERGCDERDLGLVPEHRRRQDPRRLNSVYPGASYVDWTCLDGYNGNNPWRSFVDLYRATYDRVVAVAPDKPMIVGEIGSTESGGSKAQWIADMFAALPTHFPAIRGLMWFDKVESGPGGYSDWRLESSTMSSAAFAHGIAATRFKSDEYAAHSPSPTPSWPSGQVPGRAIAPGYRKCVVRAPRRRSRGDREPT